MSDRPHPIAAFPALLGDFRRRSVLLPVVDGVLLSAEQQGLRWLYAFTGEDALAEFARGRGETGEWEYARTYGAHLLDAVVPLLGFPCGVAVDTASEGGLLLPPARGVVPEAAAYDHVREGEPHERR